MFEICPQIFPLIVPQCQTLGALGNHPDGLPPVKIGLAIFSRFQVRPIRHSVCGKVWVWPSMTPEKGTFPWGSGHPANTWFSKHTRVHTENGTSIGSSVFARLTVVSVCDTQTHTETTKQRQQ